MKTITTMAGMQITWNDGNVVHRVEGAADGGDLRVYWTLCHFDVPDDAVLGKGLTVTCTECLEVMKNR